MPMKWSTRFVKAALLNIVVALVLCTVCEFLAFYVFHSVAPEMQAAGWSWPMFGINFVVSWGIAIIIGMIPGVVDGGFKWAMKYAKPSDGLKFGALINVPVNSVYACIINLAITTLDACILGGAPAFAIIPGWLMNIVPVWIFCYIVTLFVQGPIENLARKLCHDSVPAQPAQ